MADDRPGGGEAGGGGAGEPGANGGPGEGGAVRGESESRLPGLPDGPGAIGGGTGIGVALGLMLLALAAGFATPALRDRLHRS